MVIWASLCRLQRALFVQWVPTVVTQFTTKPIILSRLNLSKLRTQTFQNHTVKATYRTADDATVSLQTSPEI